MHKNETCLKRSLEKSFSLEGAEGQNSGHFRFDFDMLEDDTDCFTIDAQHFLEMTTCLFFFLILFWFNDESMF